MDWSRAKTILIILLFSVNVFLLGTYMFRENEERETKIELRRDTCEALLKQNVSVEEDIVPLDSVKIDHAILQSENNTEKIAKALFGEVKKTEDNQNTVYSGEAGNIMFSSDAFSFLYNSDQEVKNSESAMELAKGIASKLGIKAEISEDCCKASAVGYEVNVNQIFGGVPVFDASVELRISSSGSVIGSGRFIGKGRFLRSEGETLNTSALLFEFADGIRKEGHSSIKIQNIEYGYTAKNPAAGRVSLSPALRISTDRGVFLVEMSSGKIITSANSNKKV